MQEHPNTQAPAISRRDFIRSSSVAAVSAAAAVNFPSIVSAQSKQPIRAVIIGVGGRGSGAGENFNEAVKNLGIDGKIVAVADMFPDAAAKAGQIFNVPEQNRFSGFDAYQKAIEVPGVNYCILATPPGFRAPHFKACIAAGKNVFMEKPVAVDAVGIRMVYDAADEATKKNLKVAAGTQRVIVRVISKRSNAFTMAQSVMCERGEFIGSTAAPSGTAAITAKPTWNGRYATGTITSGCAAITFASSTSTISTSPTGS